MASIRPKVTLRQGTFVGTTLKGEFPQVLDAFYNIPYAQSTAGENRFRPPIPLSPSTATHDASTWGQRPPTLTMPGAELEMEGEDCLNLNIFKPQGYSPDNKLPVMVMFNGGAFNMGSARMRQISSLIGWSTMPILGVSFNYRVNAFGFLNCSLMKNEGCLNVGLKDQVLLLKWIKENIGSFGGNPEDITAVGYSAGAHSIGHHLMNPNESKSPPFHRAILESGAPIARLIYPASHALNEAQFQDFLRELKLDNVPDDQILPRLRSLPFQDIRDAAVTVFINYSPSMRWPFQPVIDGPGGMIPVHPIEVLNSAKFFRMPILTGFCTNEGSMFVSNRTNDSTAFSGWFQTLLPGLGASDVQALAKLYPDPIENPGSQYLESRPGIGKQYQRLAAAYGQFAYISPVRQMCHILSTTAAETKPPVYLYEFGVVKMDVFGARHSDHCPHTDFMPEVVKVSDTNKQIAGHMNAYWTSFIATGDPNAVREHWPERPKWETYEEDTKGVGKKMVLGVGNDEIAGGAHKGVVSEMRPDSWARDECEFWWKRVGLLERENTAKL